MFHNTISKPLGNNHCCSAKGLYPHDNPSWPWTFQMDRKHIAAVGSSVVSGCAPNEDCL